MNCESTKENKTNGHFWTIFALGLIFILALLIRLYPVIKYPENVKFGMGQFGDSYIFNNIAHNLYKLKSFSCTVKIMENGKEQEWLEPVITRGPVYPFFMFLVYKFLGSEKDMESIETWHKNWDKVRIVQSILDAGVCFLIYFIVRFIYPASIGPALISAFLYCFSFYNIYYSKALLSESLATFLLSLSIFSYIAGLKQNRKSWLILAGAGLGLTILARPEYILLPFVLAIYIFLINRRISMTAIKKSTIFIVSVIIIIAPWTGRNYLVFKKPVIVSTGELGYSFFLGTFEGNQKWQGWGNLPEEIPLASKQAEEIVNLYRNWHYLFYIGSIKIIEVDKYFAKLAFSRIQKHTLLCLKSWLKNIPRLWYQNYIPMYVYKEASGIFFIFYFLFALYALLKSQYQERILIAPVFLIFIYLTLIFLPLHIEPRYGVSLMPAIISLAGIGLWKVFEINFIRKRLRC